MTSVNVGNSSSVFFFIQKSSERAFLPVTDLQIESSRRRFFSFRFIDSNKIITNSRLIEIFNIVIRFRLTFYIVRNHIPARWQCRFGKAMLPYTPVWWAIHRGRLAPLHPGTSWLRQLALRSFPYLCKRKTFGLTEQRKCFFLPRWLVGSSSMRICGLEESFDIHSAQSRKFPYFFIHIKLKATRHFCPPDKLITFCMAVSPVIPNRPSSVRYCSVVLPGNFNCKTSTQLTFIGSWSTKCWVK